MRYHELFEEQAPGTYVGVRFTPETIEGLTAFQKEIGVPNPLNPEKFHATVVYSREPVEWTPQTDLTKEDVEASGWDVFENRRDGTKCLVLRLSSEFLQERFDTAIEAGATHDFPDYKPHITLSYDIGTFETRKLALPEFPIVLDHEYVEPLRDSWAKGE